MIKRKAVLNRKSARVHDGPLMFINNSIITYPIAFTLYSFDFKCVYVCLCVGCLMTKGKQTKKCEIKAQSKTFSSINFTRIDLYWQLVIPNDMKSAQVERKKNQTHKKKNHMQYTFNLFQMMQRKRITQLSMM